MTPKVEIEHKSGSYKIFRDLARGRKKFGDFLKEGIPRRTLSDRLIELETDGYARREVEMTHPPTVFYVLTESGQGKFKEMILKSVTACLDDLNLVCPEKAQELLSSYRPK